MPPVLSIVIPTRSTREMTVRCLVTATEVAPPDTEFVLVDDASDDETVPIVRKRFPHVRIVAFPVPRGFTGAANAGVEHSSGDTVLLLNSDTELPPGALQRLLDTLHRHREVGIVGANLIYPDGSAQWSGGSRPGLTWLFLLASGLPALFGRSKTYRRIRSARYTQVRRVDWVTGAAMAFRREVWDAVGPLDESFRFYCQDLDFCVRAAECHWNVVIVPDFVVVHHHGRTIRRQSSSAAGRQDPTLLWMDLLLWLQKAEGERRMKWGAGALTLGGTLRVAGRTLVPPFLRWRNDPYCQALSQAWSCLKGTAPAKAAPKRDGDRQR